MSSIFPSLGLYWLCPVDPTAGAGISAPLNQLLFRTDAPSLYYKSGSANTAWTLLGGGAAIIEQTIISYGQQIFGSGDDGNVTFDGITTVLGMVPASGVYTNNRGDLFLDTAVVAAGVRVKMVGYRMFCKTLLDLATSTSRVDFDGNSGVAGTNGNSGGGVGGAAVASTLLAGSLAGGSGGSFTGGNAGGASSAAPRGFASGTLATAVGGTAGNPGGTGVNGGVGQGCSGGGGGGHIAGTGTAAGTPGNVGLAAIANGDIRVPESAITGRGSVTSVVFTSGSAGSGGGAGGNTGGVAQGCGGGGGAGGAYCFVAAKVVTGLGIVASRGGNGGNGGAAVAVSNGGGGGGGGAGGGIAVLYSTTAVPNARVLITGGTGGTGGAGGTGAGNGGAGGNAGDGLRINVRVI